MAFIFLKSKPRNFNGVKISVFYILKSLSINNHLSHFITSYMASNTEITFFKASASGDYILVYYSACFDFFILIQCLFLDT